MDILPADATAVDMARPISADAVAGLPRAMGRFLRNRCLGMVLPGERVSIAPAES